MRELLTADLLGRTNFGVIFGLTAIVFIRGFGIGPTIGSLAWQAGGYDLMLAMAVCIGGLGAVLMLAAGKLSTLPAQTAQRSTGG